MNIGRLFLLSFCITGFTACSSDESGAQAPFSDRQHHVIVRNNIRSPDLSLGNDSSAYPRIEPAAGRVSGRIHKAAAAYDSQDVPGYCRLKDRFDRKELIAYNFTDGQSRLGLKLDTEGFSFSDAGDFGLEEIKLVFRYRFQDHQKKREKCLYRSSWQGLLGSGYNELYLREDNTVYEELDEEIEDISDKFGKLF